MDKQNEKPKTDHKGDTILGHPFGEAYAMRCEEEGFGGTYAPNQTWSKEDKYIYDKVVHENQVSEVKEKERGGNQSKHSS